MIENPEALTKIRFPSVWFLERYVNIGSAGIMGHDLEMLFRHLVWRIEELERKAGLVEAEQLPKK